MPLNHEDRMRLLGLLHELGPSGDREQFVHVVREMGPAALEELGELPGLEPIRAGLLRVLPSLVDDLEPWLKAADEALAVYPAMAREEDPALTLTRHPAWVALAALELAELRDTDGLDRALTLAAVGFEGTGGIGPGELLWAMAEQAEEHGWTGRSGRLLAQAAEARFDEESHRGEVQLLLALRWAEDGDPRAVELLDKLTGATGPTQRRVHAAWVLSALVREDDPQRAIRALSEAQALLLSDADSDAAVLGRVQEALRGLGAPDVPSA